MPTYEYVCDDCGHAFELFQQMTARVKRTCPECGRKTLRRLIGTGAGVIFRGSGFYETDYRSDSYRKAAEADKKSSDGTGGAAKDGAKAKGKERGGAGSGGQADTPAKKPSRPGGKKKT